MDEQIGIFLAIIGLICFGIVIIGLLGDRYDRQHRDARDRNRRR